MSIDSFLLLFARITGFFLISPLFSGRGIPQFVRLGLAFVCSLLLAPPLTSDLSLSIDHPLQLLTQMLTEVAVGYLLGFLFSLLFEAAAFAGQVVGTLTGFSATELFDRSATPSHPLIGRLFVLVAFTLFLSLDFHHILLRVLYESFILIPITSASLSQNVILGTIDATARLFPYALAYAIFPLTLLTLVFILFALISRRISFFWIGFPIQLLIGFGAIGLTIGFFAPILEQSFFELLALVKKILFPL